MKAQSHPFYFVFCKKYMQNGQKKLFRSYENDKTEPKKLYTGKLNVKMKKLSPGRFSLEFMQEAIKRNPTYTSCGEILIKMRG